MYQSLIWAFEPGNDARGLRAPLDAKDLQCLANTLVHRVRRDVEFSGDFLGGEVLVDEAQAIKLASR